ncbi:MAG: hypothetical protein K2G74_09385 [Muribaculaceae bacterium]|nr:hypothetical protein [Muribaculaceae bacterium]
MGLFDKLKKLSGNLSVDKAKDLLNSVNTNDIKEKLDSATDTLNNKITSINEDDITSKFESATDSIKEKIKTSFDKKEEDKYEEAIEEEVNEVDDEEYKDNNEEDVNDDDENDYNDDYNDEDDEELKARRKERNKKIAKGVAKGAMFVGSFLWAQREGADSSTSLLHAFSKTKDVDSLFDGNTDDEDEKSEKNPSKNKRIKAIAHYEYICPKNRRVLDIDVPDLHIPTASGNGDPTSDEAVEAIMNATGVNNSQARSIWNGGDSLAWHKVSYTSVDDKGKRGMTVKCR